LPDVLNMKLDDAVLFRQQALIGGKWRDATDGARFAVHNPANARIIGHAPRCTAADTERAIAAATPPSPPGATRPRRPARKPCAAGSS